MLHRISRKLDEVLNWVVSEFPLKLSNTNIQLAIKISKTPVKLLHRKLDEVLNWVVSEFSLKLSNINIQLAIKISKTPVKLLRLL